MILEEQRFLHEDLERLEQGISDRIAIEPRQVRSTVYVALQEFTSNALDIGPRKTQSRPSSRWLP